jgi:hypothetical protein
LGPQVILAVYPGTYTQLDMSQLVMPDALAGCTLSVYTSHLFPFIG